MAWRACDNAQGGTESSLWAAEPEVRDTRSKAVKAVQPWIDLLADARQCVAVRQAMEALLKVTKEEYDSTLSMRLGAGQVR